MKLPARTDQCIPAGGHVFKAWVDNDTKPPRPIGLMCLCCSSWWPIAVSHYIIFTDETKGPGCDLGHTIDGRHLDRTRCGKPMTPGTWTTNEHPDTGCGACFPRPGCDDINDTLTLNLDDEPAAGDGGAEDQLGLWQDVE
ncbi:hypothetical protein [Streptosporangium sp. NPDC048865]|uniref:hypothetical protein n=1 Tax=Streptosporangium sp. NPDC048865 TaxID=3155766 RepID=UPI00344A9362